MKLSSHPDGRLYQAITFPPELFLLIEYKVGSTTDVPDEWHGFDDRFGNLQNLSYKLRAKIWDKSETALTYYREATRFEPPV
jgi:hypothetical protein